MMEPPLYLYEMDAPEPLHRRRLPRAGMSIVAEGTRIVLVLVVVVVAAIVRRHLQ